MKKIIKNAIAAVVILSNLIFAQKVVLINGAGATFLILYIQNGSMNMLK